MRIITGLALVFTLAFLNTSICAQTDDATKEKDPLYVALIRPADGNGTTTALKTGLELPPNESYTVRIVRYSDYRDLHLIVGIDSKELFTALRLSHDEAQWYRSYEVKGGLTIKTPPQSGEWRVNIDGNWKTKEDGFNSIDVFDGIITVK